MDRTDERADIPDHIPHPLMTILLFVYVVLVLVMAIVDLKTKRISNFMNGLLLGVGFSYVSLGSFLGVLDPWNKLAAGGVGFMIFLLLYLITQGGVGEGDLKLIPSLGLMVGYPGIFRLIVLSSILSLPVALGLLWMKKGKATTLPYGPFLGVAFLVVMFL